MPQRLLKPISNYKVGAFGEKLAEEILLKLNFPATYNFSQYKQKEDRLPGDLIVRNKTIEVKTATYNTSGYRFWQASIRGANFMMLICLNKDYEMDRYYFIPKNKYIPLAEFKRGNTRDRVGTSLYIKKGGINEKRFKEYRDTILGLDK